MGRGSGDAGCGRRQEQTLSVTIGQNAVTASRDEELRGYGVRNTRKETGAEVDQQDPRLKDSRDR